MLVAGLIESLSFREFSFKSAMILGVMFMSLLVGWYSWRRYITVLERAERYGQRSICPTCTTYARFDIVATGLDSSPGEVALAVAPLEAAWLRVQCRKCGTAWRIPE